MASTGIQNASLLKVSIDAATIGNLMTTSMDLSMDGRDITTKDSGGNQDLAGGKMSGTIGFESLFAEDETTNYSDLYTPYAARTTVAIIFSTGVVGDKKYSANALITALSMSGGVEDNQSFSGTFSITGGTTEATIT